MSHNLKPFILEDVQMTPGEVLENLAIQIPGRTIGECYVTTARINEYNDLEFELDDGSKYTIQCRKVN